MPSLETFKRWVRADWRAHHAWRKEAREAFAFVAGDQWTEEEKSALEAQNRVPIVFNRTATILNAVVGSEINNRTEVRYFPRTLGDAEINEVLTKGAEWFRDRAGAEEEETQAFYDTLVSGIGWVESLLDFDTEADGAPMMERIDPLEMCWDSSAKRRGLQDAKRIARVREISKDDAADMFPDADEADLGARWMDREKDPASDEAGRQWSDDDFAHPDSDDDGGEDDTDPMVTIVQLQYKARRQEVEYRDPITGKRGRMGKREWARLMEMARKMGHDPQMDTRDVTLWEWRQVILGDGILAENQPCPTAPTFCPITGYWDNAKKQWFGIVRQMHDPQKYANKWLSQTLHIINSNAKGGILYEEDATDNPKELEEQWAAADSAIRLRPGGTAKVTPKPTAQMPAALMSLTEFAISSIRDVSGVNMELLGLRDQNQPGILEYQRKQAAMTTLAVTFDALRQYRKMQGEVMLYYMTEYLADGRLIRIADEEGERYEPLKVNPEVLRYDVIVDDAPSSPNNKERVWEIITNLMPVLAQAGLPKEIWAEIIEYAPFPAPLIEKLKEYASKPDQPDPMAQQAQMAALQKLLAEVEALKAEAQKDQANAVENMAQAQLAMTKAQAEPQMAQYEMIKDLSQAESARIKAGADVHRANIDVKKAVMDLHGKALDIKARSAERRT